MNIKKSIVGAIIGVEKHGSETRHRPGWMPRDVDVRLLGDRLAFLTIPPYKPPYRRHVRFKCWAMLPGLSASAIVEIDLDERELDIDIRR